MKIFTKLKCKCQIDIAKTIIYFSIILLPINLAGQKTIEVKSIIGKSYITGDISPNLAKIQALNDAKINALKTAGIEEQINSYQLLFKSEQQNDYTQFFSSEIQSELQGAVKTYEIVNERIYCKNDFEIICEVEINATIIKYNTKPDLTFDVFIEGVKNIYNNDDDLSFTIKATQECYLTIFNITDVEAFMLYPNTFEKSYLIKPNEIIQFPISRIDYTLHTEIKPSETNRLIFVFTKEPIQFIKMDKDQVTTHEDIFSWIYSITPDKRKVQYLTFIIQK